MIHFTNRLTAFLLFFLVPALQGQSPIDGISIGENYRIHPGTITQTEVFLSVHPMDENTMFASANTITFSPGFFVSEGVYATTDGGQTWFGSDTCSGEPIVFHGGDPGITIDKDGTFILTRLGASPFSGLYSHFSTDNGLTWSNQLTVSLDFLERAAVATDGLPGSDHYGRTYSIWVRFTPPFPVFISYTDDGAASWSMPAQINSPTERSAGGDITVDAAGNVHACWAGVTSSSPFTEIFVGYAKSSDGGVTWTVLEEAFETRGIQGILVEKQNIRVNGQPRITIDHSSSEYAGSIYIVTAQRDRAPAGSDPDIILNRSRDGGQTWSDGIRVNQDALNNGKIQYFPAITVDHLGGINIIYYDDRNTTSERAGVMLSRSVDGGDTWGDIEIADHDFQPVPIGGLGQGYQGDNLDIARAGDRVWPVWMDNSTGTYQIWTNPIDILTSSIQEDSQQLPGRFELGQNYPNPFNPSTNVRFRLSDFGFVTITVHDAGGGFVDTIVNEDLGAGSYVARWDGTDHTGEAVASGVYFYSLEVKSATGQRSRVFQQSRKMLLIR